MADVTVEIVDSSTTIQLGTSGPQGASGVTPALAYAFTQASASATWNISHGLSFIPNITVVDSAGSVVEGDYSYPDENTVLATFSGAFAGKAYLS
jgi:hypothetical protein